MNNKIIELETKYSLDLGSSPVNVKTICFTENGVKCEYLDSYAGRIEELSYELFKMNGYSKPIKDEGPHTGADLKKLKLNTKIMNSPEEYLNLIALLEKALEFYANKSNYKYPDFAKPRIKSQVDVDGGSQAQFALEQSKILIEANRKMQEDYDKLMTQASDGIADVEALIKAYKILDNDNNNNV